MKKMILVVLYILITQAFTLEAKETLDNKKSIKKYDIIAKTVPSVNDVYAAIFNWFAMFDHQQNVNLFIDYIDPHNIDYNFLGEKVQSIESFKAWYKNVENNIQYNSHMISDLQVEKITDKQYNVKVVVYWKAIFYDKSVVEKTINQNIQIKIMENKIYIVKIEATENKDNNGKNDGK